MRFLALNIFYSCCPHSLDFSLYCSMGLTILYITTIFFKPAESQFGCFAFQWPSCLIILSNSREVRKLWQIPHGLAEPEGRIFSGFWKWELCKDILLWVTFNQNHNLWMGILRLKSLCNFIVSILILYLYLVVCFCQALEAILMAAIPLCFPVYFPEQNSIGFMTQFLPFDLIWKISNSHQAQNCS